jgi:hypothetical protein
LATIFKAYYGGFLQTFQFASQLNKVREDPKEAYQRSQDFLNLVAAEIGRANATEWLADARNKIQGDLDFDRSGSTVIELACSTQS